MLGKELKLLRNIAQCCQHDLAKLLGCSVSTISNMEQGIRKISKREEAILRPYLNARIPQILPHDKPGHKTPDPTRNTSSVAAPEAAGKDSMSEQEQESEEPGNYLAYTDGGCAFNPGGCGGIGIVVINQDTGEFKELSKGYEATTNNRMEMRAALEALAMIPRGSNIVLYSDSQYLINTMNGSWKRKKNLDLWKQLDAIAKGKKIQYKWVRGHNGDPLNERCDELATQGIHTWPKEIDEGYEDSPNQGQKKSRKWEQEEKSGAFGVLIGDLPEPETRYKYHLNPSCEMAIQIFNAKKQKSFKDYMNLKTGGMDGWSKIEMYKLREMVGEEAYQTAHSYLDWKGVLSCLKWYGRGLSFHDSIRKVLVDQEIQANCLNKR